MLLADAADRVASFVKDSLLKARVSDVIAKPAAMAHLLAHEPEQILPQQVGRLPSEGGNHFLNDTDRRVVRLHA